MNKSITVKKVKRFQMSNQIILQRVIYEDNHVEFDILLKMQRTIYHLSEDDVKDIQAGLNKALINLSFHQKDLSENREVVFDDR